MNHSNTSNTTLIHFKFNNGEGRKSLSGRWNLCQGPSREAAFLVGAGTAEISVCVGWQQTVAAFFIRGGWRADASILRLARQQSYRQQSSQGGWQHILRNRAAEERQKRGSILHSLRDGSRVALIFAMSGSRRVAAFFVIGLQKREA